MIEEDGSTVRPTHRCGECGVQAILLGTGAPISDCDRTVTMVAVDNGIGLVLVDCGGDAIQKMLRANLNVSRLGAIIVTHEHPDHVAGFPLLLQKLELMGRTTPLPVICNTATADVLTNIAKACGLANSGSKLKVVFDIVDPLHSRSERMVQGWNVTLFEVAHSVPTLGVQFVDRATRRSIVFSSDTGSSDTLMHYARGVHLLIHEACGSSSGHSTALDAARVASTCGVGRLVLVHLPPSDERALEDLKQAREVFPDTAFGKEDFCYCV